MPRREDFLYNDEAEVLKKILKKTMSQIWWHKPKIQEAEQTPEG